MSDALWAAIPTVDFSAFPPGCASDPEATPEQLETALQIDAVCRVHGFLTLSNVGIEPQQLESAFGAAKELFSLPCEEKAKLTRHEKATGTNRGYFPPDTEALNPARANDIKEAFNVRATDMERYWAGTPVGFRQKAEETYAAVAELAMRVLHACALALNLPPDFFTSRHEKKDLCTLRLLHYPPTPAAPGDADAPRGRVRAGEHTDFGAITLVFVDAGGGADAASGLQVRRPGDAGWLDVIPPPGTVVVNTGGLLARWTNDAWVATAHRVVVTPASAATARYSMAYFTDPDSEVMVECLPAYCGPSNPAKYAPISSLDYLLAKLSEAQRANG